MEQMYLHRLTAQPLSDFYLSPMVHILCNRSIEVEGCSEVLDFEDGQLVLDMGQWQVELNGENLSIRTIAGKRLIVDGILSTVAFKRNQRRNG